MEGEDRKIFSKKYKYKRKTFSFPKINLYFVNHGCEAGTKAYALICIFKEPEPYRFRDLLVAEPEPSYLPGNEIGTRIISNSPVRSSSCPWYTLPGTEAETDTTIAVYSKAESKSQLGYFTIAGVAFEQISLNYGTRSRHHSPSRFRCRLYS